jgi:hypothetical protein
VSQVFVSYSRRDGREVSAIANELKEAGHKVWLDKSTIQGGARWQEEIVRGIESTDVFVVMLSPYAVRSENVEREIGLAYTASKTILPVMLHRAEIPARLEYALCGREIIDISDEDAESGSRRVVTALASPELRTRGISLNPIRGNWSDRALLYFFPLALFIATGMENLGGRFHWVILAALASPLVWLFGGNLIFWDLFRFAFRGRLKKNSMLISTRMKGLTGSFRWRIVSEWKHPTAGKLHEFYSRPISYDPEEFLPREIRVIADRKNLCLYQMDLSFLPKNPEGVLHVIPEDRRATPQGRFPRDIFVSYSKSKNDHAAVSILFRELEAAGHQIIGCDEDDRDEASAHERVIQEIQKAQLFLVALSEDSVRMSRVQRELDLAISLRKPVIAMALDPSPMPEEMAYALAGTRKFDLSQDLNTGVARVLETITADPSLFAVTYKVDRLGLIRRVLAAAYPFFSVLFFLPLFIHLGSKLLRGRNRASVILWLRTVRARLGIWTDADFRTRGAVLITDYKGVETGNDGRLRVVTQWRDPVSSQLYRFKSDDVWMSPSQLIGTRTILVYANPRNLSRYFMDLPLPLRKKDKPAGSVIGRGEFTETMQKAIFLSCSEQDAERFLALKRKLEARGFELLNGGPGNGRTRDMIAGAQKFVMVIPANDATDLAARIEELRLALSSGKAVVPVILRSTSAMPSSMKYALAGVHCIDLRDGTDDGVETLVKALRSSNDGGRKMDPVAESAQYPVRTRFTGAWIGALCVGLGSIPPAFLLHGRLRAGEALLGGLIAGIVCGGVCGAVFKPRMNLHKLVPIGIFVVLFGAVFIYFPVYYLAGRFLKIEDPGGYIRAEAFPAVLLGYAALFVGKTIEDRFLIRRLKTRGKLLLTEYRGIDGRNVMSQWRDPDTQVVHVFQGEARELDPSRALRTTTIAVFVNPTKLDDYYMDLAFDED